MNESNSPLGKQSPYIATYSPELLFPIPRKIKREEIGINEPLPFDGVDIWNAYEISWLDLKGKPRVAIGMFTFPCSSPNIIESKSFKLYLNSFNQTRLSGIDEFKKIVVEDLSRAAGAPVDVDVTLIGNGNAKVNEQLSGETIDHLDIVVDTYVVAPELLHAEGEWCEERLHSDLLKSNCLVTGQPDWASITIAYAGKKIDREGLLKYLISFRCHHEFHEQCVERIYADIMHYCKPEKLTVYARYTRRGGLDINPFRTNSGDTPANIRLTRQ